MEPARCKSGRSPPLRPLVTLIVQLLVLELCGTLLACLLVLLAVGLLAVHAAVFDEAAGRAVLELDGVAPVLAAIGAGFFAVTLAGSHATHHKIQVEVLVRRTVVDGQAVWDARACEIVRGVALGGSRRSRMAHRTTGMEKVPLHVCPSAVCRRGRGTLRGREVAGEAEGPGPPGAG